MTSNMSKEELETYMRNLNYLHELQIKAFSSSPLLAALISSTIPQSGVAAAIQAARANSTSASIPEDEESPPPAKISPSSSTPSPSTLNDAMASASSDDFTMRLLLQMLQNQAAAATSVSTAASMPNLMSIGGSLPFSMAPPTTVPSSLAGLGLFSTPSTTSLLEQQLAFQSSLMRPRVNSAASSSTSSSSLSSPNPTSSPERRRKRARSLLIKAEEAALKISQDAKLKRSEALAEAIEDEQQRRELAASVMAASANGTLTTLKSTSPSTKGLLEDFPKITLRPLIPEAALPETVGPDSPYRHHPKYQKKNQDAATDFLLGQSFASFALNKDAKKDGEDSGTSSTSSSLSSLQGNPEALKMMLSKFMDDVISGELVASN